MDTLKNFIILGQTVLDMLDTKFHQLTHHFQAMFLGKIMRRAERPIVTGSSAVVRRPSESERLDYLQKG